MNRLKYELMDDKYLKEILISYLKDPRVREMKRYIQHGTVTTHKHCFSVAMLCLKMNRRFHLGADEKTMVTGALLHDFFLYDWHGKDDCDWTHSYKHPLIACDNAIKYFDINEKEQNIIRSHMWPYTFWRLPKSKEAWILVVADKCCSMRETLFCRNRQ